MILLLKTPEVKIVVEILNMKEQLIKILDTPLGRKIVISADFSMSVEFNNEVLMAIKLVEEEMKCQGIDISKLKDTNFIISENGEVSIKTTDVGDYIYFSVINYSEIKKFNQTARIAILIEELVHNYWNINDEEKIKYIDIAILRRFDPNVKVEDIFDMATIPEDKKRNNLLLTPKYFDK